MPHTEGAESRRREAPPHRGSETPIRGCPAPWPPFDTGAPASLRCPDLVSTSALRSPHLRHPRPDRPPAPATHPPHLRHPHSNRRASASASQPRSAPALQPPAAPTGPASSKPPKADARSAGTLTSPGTAGVAREREYPRRQDSARVTAPELPRPQANREPHAARALGSRVARAPGARVTRASGSRVVPTPGTHIAPVPETRVAKAWATASSRHGEPAPPKPPETSASPTLPRNAKATDSAREYPVPSGTNQVRQILR